MGRRDDDEDKRGGFWSDLVELIVAILFFWAD